MSLEAEILKILEEAVRKAAEKLIQEKQDIPEDDTWLRPGEACRLLGCDPAHLNKLIDNGFLSLSVLPGSKRGDRRVSKKEVLELKAKFTYSKRTR